MVKRFWKWSLTTKGGFFCCRRRNNTTTPSNTEEATRRMIVVPFIFNATRLIVAVECFHFLLSKTAPVRIQLTNHVIKYGLLYTIFVCFNDFLSIPYLRNLIFLNLTVFIKIFYVNIITLFILLFLKIKDK